MDPKTLLPGYPTPPKEIKEGGRVVAVTREYRYADGTVETWRTAPDADPETTGELIDSYTDKDQATKYQKDNPAPARTPADTASNSPADRALDAEKQREREWNRDNGGLYETHAERRTREAAEAQRTEATARTNATAAETARHNRASETQTATQNAATARELVTAQDGTKWIWDRQTNSMTPAPGANKPLPSGIGQFQPDPSKPSYGLVERRDALLQLVAKGTITYEQAKDILEQDRAITTALTSQQSQVINAANTAYDNLTTQRAQDIGLTESRAGTANTQFANAMSFANQNAVGLARSPGVKDIFSPLLRSQQLHQQRGGGMETPAAIPQPKALERFMTIELPGSAKVSIPVGITDKGPGDSSGGTPPNWDTVPYQGQAPAAQPVLDSTQPPARDDYSTNSDTSGGTPQAMSNAHPMMSHFADDPELQSFVASQVGVG